MSLVLRELDELLPLTGAVAVCEALPVDATVKWPNDVWIDRRKVAGILVEGRPQEGWAVLGVGLNVTTTERMSSASRNWVIELVERLGANGWHRRALRITRR